MQMTSGYVYIPVSNLQSAAAWYTEHLGFKLVKEDPMFLELRAEPGIRILLITNEDGITSHMHYQAGTQASYGFTVTDIIAAYQHFIDTGIEVGRISHYEGTSFSFHDPDGNVIELWGDYKVG